MRRIPFIALAFAACWPLLASTQSPKQTSPAFLGEPDAPRVAALRHQPIAEVEKGRGGRSLAFLITLEDGTKGYFKPKQTFSAAHWYSEVAAYYLDRELGFGRVPPTTGRRLAWSDLESAAHGDRRVSELRVDADGTLQGAFIWWIPEPLKRLRMGRKWERWVRVQKTLPITPYQRPVDYRSDLNGRPGVREATDPRRPEAGRPDLEGRPAELSDLIVFDYLTQNVDRWGGDFTNVRTRGPGGPLIYLDNGAGFWLGQQRLGLMEARLKALQRFRRSSIEAVRQLDVERFAERLRSDPLAPVLNQRQLQGLEQRRVAVLEHVQAMIDRFGESKVLPW
ncbi:MAG: hypothetical protein PVH21_00575 [Myxococcales bacterium]